jgi:amino-acid N-acetyltransferase
MIDIQPAAPFAGEIIRLLESEKLPFQDLPSELTHFLVAIEDGKVVGLAGLEPYGTAGLLRSVVTARSFRRQGIADRLIEAIEGVAAGIGIQTLILLTETAADYFAKKGFTRITREEVPETVKASSEFAHVCPASAVVMMKAGSIEHRATSNEPRASSS